MLVDKAKIEAFSAIKKDDSVNIDAYGKVLASGYGQKPPPEIIAEMQERYGFTFPKT
ncbi:MAG: hypothetical protein K2Q01_01170 [Rickettsiales bacterium]|nr:hypothetical protein [Rickettsiales bacterium]